MIFIDWFDPAYKAGGPVTAARNFVDNMSAAYDIYIFTSDRDLGDQHPLPSVTADEWTVQNQVKIFYASPSNLGMSKIRAQINAVQPDIIYLHSLFSKAFAIWPLWLHRFGGLKQKMVLAPRGMLRSSALAHKSFKKKIYLWLFKLLRLQKGLVFHATDETEHNDVRQHFGSNHIIITAPDFPSLPGRQLTCPQKLAGTVRMIFVGRIHPIKNLDFLLTLLPQVKSNVVLTIIATIEDSAYWQKCEALMKQLPAHVKVDFRGGMQPKEIKQVLELNHIFVLPTKGENFGHAIFEALAAGRPVLISDQTPWRGLEQKKAGWDVPLDQPATFAAAIEQAADMNSEELNLWCTGAWNFSRQYIQSSGIKEQYIKLFS